MIIDFHTHIYPRNVANKILPAAKKKLNIEVPCDGSPQNLLSCMNSSKIDYSVILPLAKGKDDVQSLNEWVRSVCAPGMIAFGAIHPLMDGLEDELDRLASSGIKGVKMMPLLQMVYPDDPRCGRLYEAVIRRDMMLITHAGKDPLDRDEIFGTPDRFAKVIESYPDLRLILAHLGGLRMWEDVRKYLLPAEGDVLFDTSYASFYMGTKEMAELINDLGTDRVLFGSDYPWEDPGRAANIIKGLDLSEKEVELLLWKNAAELLDIVE